MRMVVLQLRHGGEMWVSPRSATVRDHPDGSGCIVSTSSHRAPEHVEGTASEVAEVLEAASDEVQKQYLDRLQPLLDQLSATIEAQGNRIATLEDIIQGATVTAQPVGSTDSTAFIGETITSVIT